MSVLAAVRSVDYTGIVPPTAADAGVFWRAPNATSFEYFTASQWRAVAPFLVNSNAERAVADQLAVASRTGCHVLCWAMPPPARNLPPIGSLFFADVVVWTHHFTAADAT